MAQISMMCCLLTSLDSLGYCITKDEKSPNAAQLIEPLSCIEPETEASAPSKG